MSERTTADDVAAAFSEARGVFADAFLADRYELLADVPTEDAYGGRSEVEAVVESGRCLLTVGGQQGREGGQVVQAVGPYLVDLPAETAATPAHRIRINGREFAITSVKRGGDLSVFVRLELEERSRS